MKVSSVSLLLLGLLVLNASLAFGQQQGQGQGQGQGQQQQEQGQQGPYVFQEQHFAERFQTEHGRIRELPRFTQRSELLQGIDNYRFAVLEANPNTFIVPNHLDAELLVFVGQGNGAVSFVLEDRTESFDIRRGDIFRVPAGTTHYIVNKDNNRRLVLVKLLQPVSNPGEFEPFFGAGGENPQSFYRAFSNEVLEAIFKSNEVEIDKIFRQKQGAIVSASQQQIQALSQHHGSRPWPFRRGQQAEETINIFEKRPVQSNQFGKLYEVSNNDYQPLQELNVAVSFANITHGAMTAPVYNSKAWKLAFVFSEDGYFELACPHVGQQGQGKQQQQGQRRQESQGAPSYQRVSGPLRRATVVVVPPGHPAVFVASNNNNLEVLCFDINANRNQKVPLAGRGNVYDQLERVAKELSFGAPWREIDQVFHRNREQFFFSGPHQHGGGRAEE